MHKVLLQPQGPGAGRHWLSAAARSGNLRFLKTDGKMLTIRSTSSREWERKGKWRRGWDGSNDVHGNRCLVAGCNANFGSRESGLRTRGFCTKENVNSNVNEESTKEENFEKEKRKALKKQETINHLLQWLDRREDSGFRGNFLSGSKNQDIEALVENYSSPALARALRDREELLAECAAVLLGSKQQSSAQPNENDLRVLEEMLAPYAVLPSTRDQSQDEIEQVLAATEEDEDIEAQSKQQQQQQQQQLILDQEKYVLPDYREGGLFHPEVLSRIGKRLNRLPREISSRSRKRASVIVPLCHVNGEPSVLFTQRSHNVNRHKGEVCFPGGMVDESDMSVVDAALRELHEEVGIHPNVVEVLGTLRCDWSEVTSITGVAVTPIVGYLGAFEELQLDPNPGEVRAFFTVPVNSLLDKNNWVVREYSPPVFREEGSPRDQVVWGLTGYILHRFVKLLPSVVFGKKITQTDFNRELSF